MTAPPVRRARRPRLAPAVLACLALAVAAGDVRVAGGGAALASARAEEEWLAEFEAVCSKTQDAMTLSSDELRALVERCAKLRPRVAALDPSRRKVYERRLQLCRDLYQFVLDTREGK